MNDSDDDPKHSLWAIWHWPRQACVIFVLLSILSWVIFLILVT